MNDRYLQICSQTSVFAAALAACAALTGCGGDRLSSSRTLSEVPGFHPGIPNLGKPFDSVARVLLDQPCVQGETERVGNTIGEVKYSKNMSYDELLKQFSSGLDFALPEWAGFKLGLNYASENKSTALSDTHSIFLSATPKSVVFLPETLKLSQEALNILNSPRANEVHRFCGDEFINRLDLGAAMMATLKVEFASEADKREFNANADIRVGLGNANVELSGNLNKLSESIRTNTKIRIRAMQFGGNPTELFSILPNDSVVCTVADLSPCLGIFSNVIKYAQSSFKNQLENAENFNIIQAVTLSYRNGPTGVWPLQIQGVDSSNELQFESLMQAFRQALKVQSEKRALAQEIMESLRDELTEKELEKLQNVVVVATQNTLRLQAELNACRLSKNFDCKDPLSLVQGFDEAVLKSKYARPLESSDFATSAETWDFESNYYRARKPHIVDSTAESSLPLEKEHLAYGVSGDGFFCLSNQVELRLAKKFSLVKNYRLRLRIDGFAQSCKACEGEVYVEINGQRMAELPRRAGGVAEIEWDGEAGDVNVAIVSTTRRLCQDSQTVYLKSIRLERILRP